MDPKLSCPRVSSSLAKRHTKTSFQPYAETDEAAEVTSRRSLLGDEVPEIKPEV